MSKWLRRFLIVFILAAFVSGVSAFAGMFVFNPDLSPEILRLRREAWVTALHFTFIFSLGGISATALAFYMVGDEEWI